MVSLRDRIESYPPKQRGRDRHRYRVMTVRMPDDLYEALAALADENEVSLNWLARSFLEAGRDRLKRKN